ncbi:MAG: hypothetical protein IJU16_05145 [Clostridia bacterium]|nr:hypothetical protein [Clostridia bacterium]
MTIGKMICLTLILLFAFYGFAHAAAALEDRFARPHRQRLYITLPLSGGADDVERQVCFAKRICKKAAIGGQLPVFTVLDMGLDEEGRKIVSLLLHDDVGRVVNLQEEACITEQTGV